MEIVSARDTFLIMLGLFNCNLCLSLLWSMEPFPLLVCTAQPRHILTLQESWLHLLLCSPWISGEGPWAAAGSIAAPGLCCRDAPAPASLQSWAAPSSVLSLQEQRCVLRARPVSGVSLPGALMTSVLNALFLGELFMLNLFWAGWWSWFKAACSRTHQHYKSRAGNRQKSLFFSLQMCLWEYKEEQKPICKATVIFPCCFLDLIASFCFPPSFTPLLFEIRNWGPAGKIYLTDLL